MKCLAYVARRHRHRSKRDRPPKVQLFRRRRGTPVRSTTSEAGPVVTIGEEPDANIANTALTDPPPPLSSGCLGAGRARARGARGDHPGRAGHLRLVSWSTSTNCVGLAVCGGFARTSGGLGERRHVLSRHQVEPVRCGGAGATTPRGGCRDLRLRGWRNPTLTPSSNVSGDMAWCGGISDLIHPSSVENVDLIRLANFAIKYD